MATHKDVDAPLTLEIDGEAITPERFVRAVRAFFDVLREVSTSMPAMDKRVAWRVQVKQGSNLFGALPSPSASPLVVDEVLKHSIKEYAFLNLKLARRHPLAMWR